MSTKTPYIGSKISLISKAEIRYEGVLYAVDTKEATVTLAKVRSFGTEDRQVPKPIPPRTETYEFIIFRGSDIKDLHVSEIPPKTDDTPQDPAIVSATSQLPPVPPTSSTNDAPPPPTSSSSTSQPLLPPSQPPTYSPFPPAPGSFSPFGVPYFKPQVMMGGGSASGVAGGAASIQRPPPPHMQPPPLPTALHPLPPTSHHHFPPYMPGQLPIPLTQKSPYTNIPVSTAPIVSTITRPDPAEDKNQSPVASSTPQTTSGVAPTVQNTNGNVTPAQTTPQAASESESPLARMNHISPPSQVTHAAPPSLLSHVAQPLDPPQPTVVTTTTVHEQPASVNEPTQNKPPPQGTQREDKQMQPKSSSGKVPLISEPPSTAHHHTRTGAGNNVVVNSGPRTERGRGRGGRKNLRGSSRSGSREGGPANQQEPIYRYENDFDFESANAQFNKQVLEEEFRRMRVGKGKTSEDVTAESGDVQDMTGEDDGEIDEFEDGEIMDKETEPEEFYDKTKSFFDSISCENPGGAGNRRTNWNEERELNTETFGVSSVNRFRRGRGRGRWRGRGRGRGDGYRGYPRRGGYRGGRGGGQRDDGRDSEDRPPRRGNFGSNNYYQRSSSGRGGYRGMGKQGRGSDRVRRSVEQPPRHTTTAGGDQ